MSAEDKSEREDKQAVFAEGLRRELRKARQFAGLTQADVSRLTGIHTSVLSRIEQGGIKEPSFLTVAHLAYVYGISLNRLVDQAGIDHAEEVETGRGWEGVDWRISMAAKYIHDSWNDDWREAITDNFYRMAMAMWNEETRSREISRQYNTLLNQDTPPPSPEMQDKFRRLQLAMDEDSRRTALINAAKARDQHGQE